ncbi:MAG: adenylate/guanylate cyclase domain-containing protein [Proteobacteria bacterium]|nr:adenylate/guanylate cyclase domain-containing protein [Pseudomonadota bacterium]
MAGPGSQNWRDKINISLKTLEEFGGNRRENSAANSVASREEQFLKHFHAASYAGIRTAAIVGLMIYDLFAIWDYYSTPTDFLYAWMIRFCMVTPVIMFTIFVLGNDFGQRHSRLLTFLAASFASVGIVLIGLGRPVELFASSFGACILTILYSLTCLRLLRREALIYCALLTLSVIFLMIVKEPDFTLGLTCAVEVAGAFAIGLTANFMAERYARKSFEDERLIQLEHERADNILFKTFPTHIARKLKGDEIVIPESFESATVLFADIVNFTRVSAKMAPELLVEHLNVIFSTYDQLLKRSGCEKIKTIGDAYMAIGGVPKSCLDHADRIVNLAIAMQRATNAISLNGEPLSIRIGIHTGPVVAGVIGTAKFSYDVWGDTVNIASRMEASATANTIQMTAATRLALKGDFILEGPRNLEIKGKGQLETWIVKASAAF